MDQIQEQETHSDDKLLPGTIIDDFERNCHHQTPEARRYSIFCTPASLVEVRFDRKRK